MGASGEVTRGAAAEWSDWRKIRELGSLTPAVLAEILDGGQAFRWHRTPDETWLGVWSNCVARLRLRTGGEVEWSAPISLVPRVEVALPEYLGLETDLAAATDALPWRSDAHIGQCIDAFPGLRILRQPFGETLLGFLCSATKQIVQIKQMVALLAERHGAPLVRVAASVSEPTANGIETVYRLPTWPELACVPEAELRKCLLGFRAKYIAETARFLAKHPGWLEETEALPYSDAKERLCSLPGVGEKVADCVLLFGAGRLEAFPVDVWILKTMAARYHLHGWKPAQLAQFGCVHFGPYAGLAQQFLFAFERAMAPRRAARSRSAKPV